MADETKPIPVPSSALIPVGGTNFASMTSVHQLRSITAGAGHQHTERAFGIVHAEDNAVGRSAQVRVNMQVNSVKSFGLGTQHITQDKSKHPGKKVTIIQASVGYTKKTRTPVHKVADKNGNVWDEKQSNLRPR